MKYLNKIASILGNKYVLLTVIVILIMLLLKQRNSTLYAESETKREHDNYVASLDSIRIIRSNLDYIIQEKSAYELKISELTKDQKDLIKRLDLNSKGRKNTPKTVIQTVSKYTDTIRVASRVVKDPNGNPSIVFSHEPSLPGKNKLKIDGKIPYSIGLTKNPKDSMEYLACVSSGLATLSINQNIEILTALYKDPKSKRMMTRVTTTYPNITFSEINSFDITDNPETKKAMKAARKEFGAGVQVGYGLLGSSAGLKPGFYLGFGVHYSPRFLQFGK